MQLKSNRNLKVMTLLALLALWGGPLSAVEPSVDALVIQISATLSAADREWIFQQARAQMKTASSDSKILRDQVDAHFAQLIAARIETARVKGLKAASDYHAQMVEALSLVLVTQVEAQAREKARAISDAIKKVVELKAALNDVKAALADSSIPSSLAALLESAPELAALDKGFQEEALEAQKQAAAAAAEAAQSYARVSKAIEQILAILKG